MDNLFEKLNDWVQAHPENGYLIVAGLLLFWLFGVIMGWKWTYESSTWKQNTLKEMLGEKGYRIGVGVLLAIALAAVLYLFFSTERRVDIQEVQTEQCQILETFTYCFEGNKVTATGTTTIDDCSGMHEYRIKPFFEDLARRQGKKPEMLTVNSYCNTLRYLSLSDSLPGDTTRQTFRVAVDILSLDNYNAAFEECLNDLRGEDFTAVDVISKAPEQCYALWEDGNLFVIWCGLFDDGERITRLIKKQGFLPLE